MAPLISMSEVKKHTNAKSVWVVIHNDVYDLTKFLDEHPGGADTLLEVAGQDGTQGFEDVQHSQDAREIMIKYKIGTLPANEQHLASVSCGGSGSNLKWAILALATAVVIGIALKKYLS